MEMTLSFEEGTAGRLMSADVISVRSDVSLGVALRGLIYTVLPVFLYECS